MDLDEEEDEEEGDNLGGCNPSIHPYDSNLILLDGFLLDEEYYASDIDSRDTPPASRLDSPEDDAKQLENSVLALKSRHRHRQRSREEEGKSSIQCPIEL